MIITVISSIIKTIILIIVVITRTDYELQRLKSECIWMYLVFGGFSFRYESASSHDTDGHDDHHPNASVPEALQSHALCEQQRCRNVGHPPERTGGFITGSVLHCIRQYHSPVIINRD